MTGKIDSHSPSWFSFLKGAARDFKAREIFYKTETFKKLRLEALTYLLKLCTENPRFKKTLEELSNECFRSGPALGANAMESAIHVLRRRVYLLIYKDRESGKYFLVGGQMPEETERKFRELVASGTGTRISAEFVGEHIEKREEIASKVRVAVQTRRDSQRRQPYVQ